MGEQQLTDRGHRETEGGQLVSSAPGATDVKEQRACQIHSAMVVA